MNQEPDLLPAEREAQLFRIVQEALNNVVRHADATEVQLDLLCNDAERTILIADNGIGFDVAARGAEGFGRSSMFHRAKAIGATLDTVSSSGEGTQVMVSLKTSPATAAHGGPRPHGQPVRARRPPPAASSPIKI